MRRTFALILAAMPVSVQQEAVAPYALTSDRLWASSASVLALVGVVTGGLALARSARRTGTGTGKVRRWASLAVVAGLVGVVIGALVLANADGGPGTGNGVVGAVIAVMLGLIAMALGGLALARFRRYGF